MSQMNRKVIARGDKFLSSIGLVRTRVLNASGTRLKCTVSNTVRETTGALRDTLGTPHLVYKPGGVIVREYQLPVNQVVTVSHSTKVSRGDDVVVVEFKPAKVKH